uniref:Uncharacterized protein n=1 Tax=Arundo donax TaxID=35708 RepID=A0A0A9F1I6_ARUDO
MHHPTLGTLTLLTTVGEQKLKWLPPRHSGNQRVHDEMLPLPHRPPGSHPGKRNGRS